MICHASLPNFNIYKRFLESLKSYPTPLHPKFNFLQLPREGNCHERQFRKYLTKEKRLLIWGILIEGDIADHRLSIEHIRCPFCNRLHGSASYYCDSSYLFSSIVFFNKVLHCSIIIHLSNLLFNIQVFLFCSKTK